ncbi:hypothetical protein ILYODFUR_032242 [Ilyodon furcidens]|uniref:Uncharacterized protein n=1 Tax=Ilyodon furcidens TaxID=33524 RepID=A0ABV0V9M2_9TELE
MVVRGRRWCRFYGTITSVRQLQGSCGYHLAHITVSVLVIFSDGLDEDVMTLENESEKLRQSGISSLLIVALEGVRNAAQLQMVEFGRGFGYKLPLSIGMPSIGNTILKQIVSCPCFTVTEGDAAAQFTTKYSSTLAFIVKTSISRLESSFYLTLMNHLLSIFSKT